jgi:hypothetical protein
MGSFRRCERCNRAIQKNNQSGYCSPCQNVKCNVCGVPLEKDESGRLCQDCRGVVAHIDAARLSSAGQWCQPAGQEERIAAYTVRAEAGLPLFG